MKRTVEINKEYGHLTVLREVERDKFDHRQYLVRCRCGKEFKIRKGQLFHSGCRCRDCAAEDYHKKVVGRIVGTIVNDFEVISEYGKNNAGAIVYKCRCIKCGSIVYRTAGELSVRKGQGCENCKPDYHFRIEGTSAYGTLKDGTVFIIDSSMIPIVSEHYWKSSRGYIECSEISLRGMKLHRFLLGVTGQPDLIVDHINRNRADCRLANLRIVTTQQNSMNRSIQKNNTTGYVGVTSFKIQGKYRARIGLNYKYISVYSSENLIDCASAYNYASHLLFGDFRGHRNDVPEANSSIKTEVRKRCASLMTEARVAKTSVKTTIPA